MAENLLNKESSIGVPKTVRKPNPFSAEHSGYGRFANGALASVHVPGSDMELFHRQAHDDVRSYILGEKLTENGRKFPCVFGEAAFRTLQYSFSAYDDITKSETATGVLHDIIRAQHELEMPATPPRTNRIYRSSLVAFREPIVRDELHATEVLYQLLANMHEQNAQHYDWPEEYSRDTDSFNFGYAAGETSHFLAYFHPEAGVDARRTSTQFVVFNSHDMISEFIDSKGIGAFDKMKAIIRDRQEQPIHPQLGNHGDLPEWPQYALMSDTPDAVFAERAIRRAILGDHPFQPFQKPSNIEDYGKQD